MQQPTIKKLGGNKMLNKIKNYFKGIFSEFGNISGAQLVLTVLAVSALLISNVITSKQVLLPFNITMTGAVFIFPITYVLSDLFSEVYGYK